MGSPKSERKKWRKWEEIEMGKHCRGERGKRRSRWLSVGCITEERERERGD